MSIFDQAPEKTGDFFVRHKPEYLRMFFGTEDVTPLWVADMDLPVADPIREAVQYVAGRGQFAYEFNSGGIFAAISAWHQRRHGLALDTANFVTFPGVLTAISLLIRELTKEGDGVLMLVPAYHQFGKLITSAGRDLATSKLSYADDGYGMDFGDLDAKLGADNVTAMIVCNPHNPVGRVWRPDELARLVELADRHGVTLISDEIHADIIFGDHRFTSLSSVDGGRHVSVIGSPAKTFGMQSISNGYVYTANADIHRRMKALEEGMYLGHGNAFTTYATIAAYEKGDAWLDALLDYLQSTIDGIADLLARRLPGAKMAPVEGTYQVWIDCSGLGLSAEALKATLGEAGFGATPGTWFDPDAGDFIRVNIAAPRGEVMAAFERFAGAVDKAAGATGEATPPERKAAGDGKSTDACC